MNINVDLSELSVDQLKRAVQLKEQITRLESELAALTGSQPRSAAAKLVRPRPTISEAGRARIVAAQRRRWARERALKAAPQSGQGGGPPPPAAAKRVLTPQARAKMSAASRERWARVRAEQEGQKQEEK